MCLQYAYSLQILLPMPEPVVLDITSFPVANSLSMPPAHCCRQGASYRLAWSYLLRTKMWPSPLVAATSSKPVYNWATTLADTKPIEYMYIQDFFFY